ncbi:putative permease [Actinoplanes missouriensis 431]|uniref:Putative permease n=1 Tax=Actinoplanes missouriensis (strain ATCC 14538 / DSM 43046 / CBS 188.64 / JCM 3121 / NBRC 102363 / NCIMB 12654 / NRRL B-3342 / UNCC 431) TaxID=512565 RepID=I0H223_ACTM4|nr:permease [Actinoplanes missouriensis]BAL87060.1 putative permease [Actinoplanes missouriensis 431]
MTDTLVKDPPARHGSRGIGSVEVLAALLVLLVIFRGPLSGLIAGPGLQTWTTVFVSVLVQAVPFLVFGVLLSAVIAVFVPASFWARALPRRPALAVPAAGLAGVVLPGCECGSVPVAGALIRRGVTPAAALAFLLASPAINPIVLTATAVAFPGNPEMVLARAVASLAVAVLMGWLWLRLGRTDWIRLPQRHEHDGKGAAFWSACRHDMVHAGGYLVIGAAAAATINVVVPESWLQTLAGNPVLSVLALAVLAVLLSICSEADAFVAASLSQFSLTSRLVFLVVGPMVDLKLIAMQTGVFGRGFASRFAPATFALAVLAGTATGWVLL